MYANLLIDYGPRQTASVPSVAVWDRGQPARCQRVDGREDWGVESDGGFRGPKFPNQTS